MVQYYWNPNYQNHNFQQPVVPPPVTIPSGRPNEFPEGERSYIENILRLNIGKPGIFHFSFSQTLGDVLSTRNITGVVEAAGRDHVIVEEAATGNSFLFPMIYFDYAEFEGEMNYFPQTIQQRQV